MPRPHPRPWHGGSVFGPGPRRRLDRNQRARFRFLLNAHKRAGRLTDKTEDVGAALLKRLSDAGRCDPSQATLANDAGCEERTVRRAICAMRDVGPAALGAAPGAQWLAMRADQQRLRAGADSASSARATLRRTECP